MPTYYSVDTYIFCQVGQSKRGVGVVLVVPWWANGNKLCFTSAQKTRCKIRCAVFHLPRMYKFGQFDPSHKIWFSSAVESEQIDIDLVTCDKYQIAKLIPSISACCTAAKRQTAELYSTTIGTELLSQNVCAPFGYVTLLLHRNRPLGPKIHNGWCFIGERESRREADTESELVCHLIIQPKRVSM